MTLVDEAKEMFERYRLLKDYLMEKKDYKGLRLMMGVFGSSSIMMDSLIAYNNKMAECCKEMMEVVKQDDD